MSSLQPSSTPQQYFEELRVHVETSEAQETLDPHLPIGPSVEESKSATIGAAVGEIDYGSIGFDFGGTAGAETVGGLGFSLSESLTRDCCVEPIITTTASDIDKVEKPVVEIQEKTLDEVRTTASVNDSRDVAQAQVVADVGTIDYGSVSFDFGGTTGVESGAGLGFSLSESLTRDCCVEPIVTTTASDIDKIEKPAVAIQEKSLEEVRTTASINDSRGSTQVQHAIENTLGISGYKEDLSTTQPQLRVEGVKSEVVINSANSKIESKLTTNDSSRETTKSPSIETPQVFERPSREFNSVRSVAPTIENPTQLIATTSPSTTKANLSPTQTKTSEQNANEALKERNQINPEIKFRDGPIRDNQQTSSNMSPRETLTGRYSERGIGNSFIQTTSTNLGNSFRSIEPERRSEGVPIERSPVSGRSSIQTDITIKGESRISSGYRTERRSTTIQDTTIHDRSSLQRVVEGLRNFSRLIKGERDLENTSVLRLSNVSGNLVIESKGIIATLKTQALAFKEQITEKVANLTDKIVNSKIVTNLALVSQRLSQFVQRIPLPERLQNIVRALRGKVRDQQGNLIQLNRNAIGEVQLSKKPPIQRITQLVKQRLREMVSAPLMKVRNLPVIRQALSFSKRAAQFLAKFELQGRNRQYKQKLGSAQLLKNEKTDMDLRPKTIRGQIRKYLNGFLKVKSTEHKIIQEKGMTLRKSSRDKQTSRPYRKQDKLANPDQPRRLMPLASRNRIAKNLMQAASLRHRVIRIKDTRQVVTTPKTSKSERTALKVIKAMSKMPLKKINSGNFLKRQAKKGNLLLLNRLRRRGLRGARKLKKYLDPRSLLYRRLVRELSLDELEKFLKGMAAQKAKGLAREFYFEPRKKKHRQSPTERL